MHARACGSRLRPRSRTHRLLARLGSTTLARGMLTEQLAGCAVLSGMCGGRLGGAPTAGVATLVHPADQDSGLRALPPLPGIRQPPPQPVLPTGQTRPRQQPPPMTGPPCCSTTLSSHPQGLSSLPPSPESKGAFGWPCCPCRTLPRGPTPTPPPHPAPQMLSDSSLTFSGPFSPICKAVGDEGQGLVGSA